MGIRFFITIGFFVFLYGLLGVRFYNIQINKGDFYAARAASQIMNKFLGPTRGNIIMRDKNNTPIPVAIKKKSPFVYVVPKEIIRSGADLKEISAKIGEITGVSESEIFNRINKPNDPFEEILSEASDEIVSKIKELNISGVYVGEKPKRYYPYGSMAAHIIGFMANNEGQYGIEAYYNEKLAGVDGKVKNGIFINPEDGKDVYLTIDQVIQAKAEKILKDTVLKFEAKGGLVIVSDPQTGKIKAMAGNPSFDPNDFNLARMSDFMNHSVQKVYEPGSVFKMITMAAAIDSGKVSPETTYVDKGELVINGRTIRNWNNKAHGVLTMREVIEKSANTGTVFAVQEMGRNIFLEYIERFGFIRETGINLPGEVVGSIRPLINGRDINFATASYGQGISVTPIRMLSAINAIANGGVMMVPRITVGDPKIEGRPISEETAKKITDMMVSSVRKNILADIPGYDVAGKTGTAKIPDLKRGGYRDAYINTYVGFAPAHNPKFSILIRIDEPKGNPLAGISVVPAFRELAEFIISYYGIPPNHIR